MGKKTKSVTLVISNILLTFLVLVILFNYFFLAYILLFPKFSFVFNTSFNQEIWMQDNKEKFPRKRYFMREDLLKNHLKKGMRNEEVLQLLGKPDNETEKQYIYNLGRNGQLMGRSELLIYFNSSNKVIEVEVKNRD